MRPRTTTLTLVDYGRLLSWLHNAFEEVGSQDPKQIARALDWQAWQPMAEELDVEIEDVLSVRVVSVTVDPFSQGQPTYSYVLTIRYEPK